MKPHFKHDCMRCQFFGHWQSHSNGGYDVYLCSTEAYGPRVNASLVLRHGDADMSYVSMPISMFDRGLPEPYASARNFIITSEGKIP
jgi:hypothetical protein